MALSDMLTPPAILLAFIAIVIVQYYSGGDTKAQVKTDVRVKSAVVVTGASRGIGKTIAAHLSLLGYTVFGSVRSQSSYDELKRSQSSTVPKGIIIPIIFDVTNDEQIAAAVVSIQKICQEKNLQLVGIVNNAGINPEGETLAKLYAEGKDPENAMTDIGTVSRVLDTNVVGCFRVTRAFLPLLTRDGRSRVVLVGSYFGTIAGALGLPHLAYETSKFALEGLADGLRRSLRTEKIGVSLIKPGNIQTDMNSEAGETPPLVVSNDVLAALEAKRPSPRYYPGMVKGLPCSSICGFFDYFPTWFTDSQV
jgi:NAD(P)-dependent dehydrogenase (short-subunit alcohol dehydrogenase family)